MTPAAAPAVRRLARRPRRCRCSPSSGRRTRPARPPAPTSPRRRSGTRWRCRRSPAAANGSASLTFAQQIPRAPAASCSSAISGTLWVLMWTRNLTPWSSIQDCQSAMLRSMRSRSARIMGVSRSSMRSPTLHADRPGLLHAQISHSRPPQVRHEGRSTRAAARASCPENGTRTQPELYVDLPGGSMPAGFAVPGRAGRRWAAAPGGELVDGARPRVRSALLQAAAVAVDRCRVGSTRTSTTAGPSAANAASSASPRPDGCSTPKPAHPSARAASAKFGAGRTRFPGPRTAAARRRTSAATSRASRACRCSARRGPSACPAARGWPARRARRRTRRRR